MYRCSWSEMAAETTQKGFAYMLADPQEWPRQADIESQNIYHPGHPVHVHPNLAGDRPLFTSSAPGLTWWLNCKCGLKSLSVFRRSKSIPAHPSALQPATFLSYSSQLSTAPKNSRVANLITQNKDALMYFAVLFLTIRSSFRSLGPMTCCFLRTQKMLLIPYLWHVLLSGDKSFCAMWQEWANVTEAERWAAAAQSAAFNPSSAPQASITSASSNNTSELPVGRRAPSGGEVLTSNKGC